MSKEAPPALARKFLLLFLRDDLAEEVCGDLDEQFFKIIKTKSRGRARRQYWYQTINYLRPFAIKKLKSNINITSFNMLANYFKVAWRVMMRTRSFSIINILGLALGMTGSILLFLWVRHEQSYDQFHENKDRLYKVWNRANENGQINCWDWTPRVLAPTLQQEFANVDHATSFAAWGSQHLFTVGKTRFTKTTGVFTESPFLTMFSFPLLKGNPEKALSEPNSLVITEDFARQLFGDREAYGGTVSLSQSGHTFEFKITGILKSLPANTDFDFEYLIPFRFLESLGEKDTFWGNNSVQTWVKLTDGSAVEAVNESIKDVVRNHYPKGKHIEIFLHALTRSHLHSRFENGVEAGGRIDIIKMLAVLGVVLLAIAVINFVNLSTARAQRRSKEVAVRKITGALRVSLVSQFLCEAVLMSVAAGLFSLLAVMLLMPSFNSLVGQGLTLPLQNGRFWIIWGGFVLGVGLLAGSYPALYLSSFRPAKILKSAHKGSFNSTLRTTLVVLQFGFAVTLIVSAIIIRKQIVYVQHRDAGYSRNQLVYLPLSGDLPKNFQAFQNELVERGVIKSITKTSAPITEQWSSTGGILWRGKYPEDRTDFERIYVDNQPSFTFELKLVEGRDFNLEQFDTDSTAAILNETALRVMGFENPIGEVIDDDGRNWRVIGVVKDFVFTSPYKKVEPIILFGSKAKWTFNVAYLKLSPDKPVTDHLANLEKLTAKYNPDYPFEYHFADAEYQRKFDDLQRTLLITTIFTSAAIAIACLGLLGLASFMTEARVKEIGIRKVLGGSVVGITRLLSASALKPIFIAVLLFVPGAGFGISWWLQSFAYRVSIDVWSFVIASFVILVVALLTICTQTIQAARANPVESLRSE